MTVSSPTDAMKALKEATAAAHEQIEEKMTVMRPEFDLEAYKSMLGKFWNFYRLHEAATRGFDYPASLEIEKRTKMPSLERDMADLGVSAEDFRKDVKLPDLSSMGARLGALYVTEGSTLGGQIISRHLAPKLALTPEHGLRFFAAYGKDTGLMWTKLGSALRAELSTPERLKEATHAATEMFLALDRAF